MPKLKLNAANSNIEKFEFAQNNYFKPYGEMQRWIVAFILSQSVHIIICFCTHTRWHSDARSYTCEYSVHCDRCVSKISQIATMTITIENELYNWTRSETKQSANVQWHHTKNKRQPLEETEKKRRGCECVCDFSCDWHDDQTSSMDMWWFNLQWHTHNTFIHSKENANKHCFVLTVISHCHWCQSLLAQQQQRQQHKYEKLNWSNQTPSCCCCRFNFSSPFLTSLVLCWVYKSNLRLHGVLHLAFFGKLNLIY